MVQRYSARLVAWVALEVNRFTSTGSSGHADRLAWIVGHNGARQTEPPLASI